MSHEVQDIWKLFNYGTVGCKGLIQTKMLVSVLEKSKVQDFIHFKRYNVLQCALLMSMENN